MPQIRIFKAESFRLAALFALVFLTLTAVLIGTVLWIVDGTERETLIAANEADISTVMNGLHGEGIGEAIEVVQQRLGNPEAGPPTRQRFVPETYMVHPGHRRQGPGGQPAVRAVRCRRVHARAPLAEGHHHPQMLLGRCAQPPQTADAVCRP